MQATQQDNDDERDNAHTYTNVPDNSAMVQKYFQYRTNQNDAN
jgi:hypothetical protein